jgi:3-vinyl bacteriochlorophyllide hydratase
LGGVARERASGPISADKAAAMQPGPVSARESRQQPHASAAPRNGLYTPEERLRRDASKWTLVQGLLAPFQFLVCLVSIGLILRFLATGEGLWAANASVVAKTLTLYAIMVTGAIWEKEVFGRYLFAPAFFWEDVVSMGVIALHTAYLACLFTQSLQPQHMMALALAAYAAYIINAAQFLLKLRRARLESSAPRSAPAVFAGRLAQ